MDFKILRNKLLDLISFNKIRITDAGPVSHGFTPALAISDYNFDEIKAELIREIEIINPPLSDLVRQELLSQIRENQLNLINLEQEIISTNNALLFDILNYKKKTCIEFLEVLQKPLNNIGVNSKPQKTIPINTSLNELAVILFGFEKAGIIPLEGGRFVQVLSENFSFKDRDGNLKPINKESLEKAISTARSGFDAGFKTGRNPIKKAEELMLQVTEHIRSIHQLTKNER